MALVQDFNTDFMESMDMVYHLGLRFFKGNSEKAEDFVQDLYVYAKAKVNTFQGKSKFSTWLYRVAVNFALNQLKKEKKLSYENVEVPESLADDRDSFSSQMEESELVNELHTQINSLAEEYRLPLLLFYYENMSISEISEKLSVPEGTIKSYLFRAKKILKKGIER